MHGFGIIYSLSFRTMVIKYILFAAVVSVRLDLIAK